MAKPVSFDFGFNARPKAAAFRVGGRRRADRVKGTTADAFRPNAAKKRKSGKGGGS